MNIRVLGMLTMAISSFFFLMTPWDKTPDQQFLVWAGAIGFFLYGLRLMIKDMQIRLFKDEVTKGSITEDEIAAADDQLFELYLNEKTWARVRFGRVTKTVLGIVLGLAVLA